MTTRPARSSSFRTRLPRALTGAERGVLQKTGLQLLDQDSRYVRNPLGWLDGTGSGLVLRL